MAEDALVLGGGRGQVMHAPPQLASAVTLTHNNIYTCNRNTYNTLGRRLYSQQRGIGTAMDSETDLQLGLSVL